MVTAITHLIFVKDISFLAHDHKRVQSRGWERLRSMPTQGAERKRVKTRIVSARTERPNGATMAFKDILLVLITYPEAANPSQVQEAVSFGVSLDARISAVACIVKVCAPHHELSDAFIDIPALVASEMKKSSEVAVELLAVFEASAKKAGVFQESLTKTCFSSEAPNLLVREARLRDLTIVPAVLEGHNYRWYAESIIFGSGRPVVILPPRGRTAELDTIAIAWDGSRPAARAVADALPILERASEVRVLTVLNEKELSSELESPGTELSNYLERRGIAAKPESIDAAGHPIGEVLGSYLTSNQADLLVMGAYGHSRVREFILGGATLSMLLTPPLPILLSH
jgi:nucleotide-binding universal stress UspA family protein